MQASLDSIISARGKGSAAAAVTFDGLLIASANASDSTALANDDAVTAALVTLEALKLNTSVYPTIDEEGKPVPLFSNRLVPASSTSSGGPSPSAIPYVAPYAQQQIAVATANCNHAAIGSDEESVMASVARSGFKGVVIETDKRTISCKAVASASGPESNHNSAFLVVAELFA